MRASQANLSILGLCHRLVLRQPAHFMCNLIEPISIHRWSTAPRPDTGCAERRSVPRLCWSCGMSISSDGHQRCRRCSGFRRDDQPSRPVTHRSIRRMRAIQSPRTWRCVVQQREISHLRTAHASPLGWDGSLSREVRSLSSLGQVWNSAAVAHDDSMAQHHRNPLPHLHARSRITGFRSDTLRFQTGTSSPFKGDLC
jgi:hypothetical protein